jgi:hypothetical protein
MCSFMPSGARQSEGEEHWHDEPHKRQRFPSAQVAPSDAVKRKTRNHNQSGQKTRRNERAMARARERILLRGRVD